MEKKRIKIKKSKGDETFIEDDVVICEYPLTIYLNDEEFITLLCTPKDLKELVYGFLISEGFITKLDDVSDFFLDVKQGICRIHLNKEIDLLKKIHGKRARTTGCGKGSIFYYTMDSIKSKKITSNMTLKKETILEISRDFNKKSELFLETGGVHSTVLIQNEEILLFYEDVGRHNTIDKIIGKSLLDGLNLNETAVFTSGRISSEMLLKTLKAGIPMIISRSAPTDLAVELAIEFDVTLIGFVRGERMNIYHDANRII